MADTTMGNLFTDEPEQWGLRGDPFAWRALREHLATTPIPTDPDEAKLLLRDAFQAVVGVDLDDPGSHEAVYREEFARGGMSSGHVHLPTWRDRLLPLLVSRARDKERERAHAAMADLAALQNDLGLIE